MPHEHEREYFRVVYPTAARPRLIGDGLVRDVVDVCEQGMRYRAADGEVRAVGDEVSGVLHFRRGEEVSVLGTVVRVSGGDVAVRLDPGIPFRVVMEEQRFLRERHRGMAW